MLHHHGHVLAPCVGVSHCWIGVRRSGGLHGGNAICEGHIKSHDLMRARIEPLHLSLRCFRNIYPAELHLAHDLKRIVMAPSAIETQTATTPLPAKVVSHVGQYKVLDTLGFSKDKELGENGASVSRDILREARTFAFLGRTDNLTSYSTRTTYQHGIQHRNTLP